MTANGKYQLLPALRPDERAALRADIAKRGVLVAVEKDEDGNILDGHNREEIAAELGIDYPTVVRRFATEREKREHVIKLNLARRHLDPVRWGQAFKLLLEERGVQDGPGRPKKGEKTATVAEIAAECGVPQRTAEHRLQQARAYESLPDPVRAKVDAGALTVPQAKREVQRKEKREVIRKKAKAAPEDDGSWRIIHGDCLSWLDRKKVGSPRLIFADPPYNIGVDYGEGTKADRLPEDKYLAWCAEWIDACASVLAADGSLWVLIGDEYADHFGLLLRRSLLHRRAWIKWYETFGVNQANNFNRCSRHLFYCVKDQRNYVFHADAVNRASDRQTKYGDKRADPGGKIWDDVWMIPRLVGTAAERIPDFPTQLPLDLLRPIIGCASDPGDLILDPFSGSASAGAAALQLGRRFVGIEKSKHFVELSTLRLKGVRHG